MTNIQVVLRVRTSTTDDQSPLRICDDNQTVELWNYRYDDTIRFKLVNTYCTTMASLNLVLIYCVMFIIFVSSNIIINDRYEDGLVDLEVYYKYST